ncbi:hypothetical protein BASA81_010591 [Batrachochytrium salamandrivorans]|nr:hypothetical protein BASA81_010591 [Batrachochytrium salamandrivorans]
MLVAVFYFQQVDRHRMNVEEAELLQAEKGWQRLFDSETNRYFYFNKTTLQSCWKPSSTGVGAQGAGGGVWKSSFSKEHNRVYYYNRSTGETRWTNPQRLVEREMNGAIELIAGLQLAKERLERDLEEASVSNLALKDQVAHLKSKLAAMEEREGALATRVKTLAASEHDLSVQLDRSHAIIEELQQPHGGGKDTQEQETEGELLSEPPSHLKVRFLVLDRYKNYRACITVEGDCYDNRGNILGYLNFASFEAGSKDEDFLGGLIESQFDNVCQVRDDTDEMVAYLDLGTRSIRGLQGNTLVDFDSDGVVKHANGTFLGEFRGAQGYHNMRELTLYLVLLDPGMCASS